MSIMETAKIEDTDSEEYRSLVSGINCQFENLYQTLSRYFIKESGFYVLLAYKCFEKAVDSELRRHQ